MHDSHRAHRAESHDFARHVGHAFEPRSRGEFVRNVAIELIFSGHRMKLRLGIDLACSYLVTPIHEGLSIL